MTLSYIFLPNQSVFLGKIKGSIDFTRLKEMVAHLWNNEDYHQDYNSYIDLREADILMNPRDISAVTQHLLTAQKTSVGKLALLVNKPFETAIAMIFETKMASRQHVMVFSEELTAAHFTGTTMDQVRLLESSVATVRKFSNHNRDITKNPSH